MRPHPRRAETDPTNPRAWATCDRCGFVTNLYKLSWQLEWRGQQLANIRILVCEGGCVDTPQRQLGTVFIPPDPPPLINARPEQYQIDEEPVSTRYTMDGRIRITMPLGAGHLYSMRIISDPGAPANPYPPRPDRDGLFRLDQSALGGSDVLG